MAEVTISSSFSALSGRDRSAASDFCASASLSASAK
jgi:hypothetical protein